MSFGNIWFITTFSFVVALSGALVPGPLLTYTIMKTLEVRKRGAMVGMLVIAGHAMLESALIIALLAGFATLLTNPVVVRVIGTAGGAVLVFLGGRLISDLLRGKVPELFAESDEPAPERLPHPILGGVIVSMSNPYWWVWWGSIGLAFMAQYNINFRNPGGLAAFFAGHEAGDLAVYWMVSFLVAVGRRKINERTYRIILFVCAVVMVFFGLFLGIKPHL
jgi:threonine/homoserine/homoserine lactone efflux protein